MSDTPEEHSYEPSVPSEAELAQNRMSRMEIADEAGLSLTAPSDTFIMRKYDDGELEETSVRVDPEIKKVIDELFPGNNPYSTMIRNALYFVWINENVSAGSSYRKKTKDFLGQIPVLKDQLRSLGPFQIRPVQKDLENCAPIFESHSIPTPSNLAELKQRIIDDPKVAAIVAASRIMDSYNSFANFMVLNGETPDPSNEKLMQMVLSSYNRSPEAIYRAVFQNWAYNLALAAGVNSDLSPQDIDSSLDNMNTAEKGFRHLFGGDFIDSPGQLTSRRLEHLQRLTINTFKRVIKKLVADGSISIDPSKIDEELFKIFTNKSGFLQSPLFNALQDWYVKKTGRRLTFIFTDEELQRGNHVFSYGARLAHSGQWHNLFAK